MTFPVGSCNWASASLSTFPVRSNGFQSVPTDKPAKSNQDSEGYYRNTNDLDFWIAVQAENARKLVRLIREFGFELS
jgi:hypothetical protein